MRRLVIALATTLLLGGCGSSCSAQPDVGGADTTEPAVVPSTQPTLVTEIGTGLDAFEALPDGGTVAVVTGPQGGQHIWTSVRVHGVPAQGLVANVSVLEDATPLGRESGWAGPWATSGDAVELVGMRAYVDRDVPAGQDVIVLVEVVAKDGRHGKDQRRVRVR